TRTRAGRSCSCSMRPRSRSARGRAHRTTSRSASTGRTSVEPELRAGDADRERTGAALREHAGAGRLDVDELDERIEAALRARTFVELDALVADLPSPSDARRHGSGFRPHLRAYVLVILLLVVVWATTGFGYPWPVWPAFGWGIGLAAHRRCRHSSPSARRMAPATRLSGGPQATSQSLSSASAT